MLYVQRHKTLPTSFGGGSKDIAQGAAPLTSDFQVEEALVAETTPPHTSQHWQV